LGRHEFVAKRYNEFSDEVFLDSEKLNENQKLISLDAWRLIQCQAFLDSFYEHANGVQRIDRSTQMYLSFKTVLWLILFHRHHLLEMFSSSGNRISTEQSIWN